MASTCPSCSRGPVRGGEAAVLPGSDDRFAQLAVSGKCGACGRSTALRFRVPRTGLDSKPGEVAVVNPTGEPSRILDVGQWLTLFRMIVEAADRTTDRRQARQLGIEGAQCLEEALRFYQGLPSDQPPPTAFFSEASRKRFAEHPEQFSKQRLVELRARLPGLATMQSALDRPHAKRPWWRFW